MFSQSTIKKKMSLGNTGLYIYFLLKGFSENNISRG